MDEHNSKKSLFQDFVNNAVIFYLVLILLGYLSTYLYFNLFNINVLEYFAIEDYVNIFFKNLIFVILLVIFYFIVAIILAPFTLYLRQRMTRKIRNDIKEAESKLIIKS